MDKFYTCREVAERYKVKAFTVQEWIRSGKLSAILVGNRYRVSESDLKEFEKANDTANLNSEE